MTTQELEREVERLKGVVQAGRELQAELVDALEAVQRDLLQRAELKAKPGDCDKCVELSNSVWHRLCDLLRKHGGLG